MLFVDATVLDLQPDSLSYVVGICEAETLSVVPCEADHSGVKSQV